MTELLKLKQVTVRRGGRTVLSELDWQISPGVTALLGVNGAGKTTLLLSALGLLTLSSGSREFQVKGTTEKQKSVNTELAGQIAWLPQEVALPKKFSVQEFYEHVAWLRAVDSQEATNTISEALKIVNLEEFSRTRMGKLSGGQKRRVALGSAFIGNPRLIFLDEPTVALDPIQRNDILDSIRSYAEAHPETALVFSTHILEDVIKIAAKIDILQGGSIVSLNEAETAKILKSNSTTVAMEKLAGLM